MSDWSRPGWLEASGWVHLVDGSVAFGCAGDGFIEAVQQFEHGLAFSSSEHRVASVVVGSSRDAADGRYFTESDRAASGEEPLDVGQCRGGYAARLGAVWTARTTFHGSNSSMRLIGWSAMRSRTCLK